MTRINVNVDGVSYSDDVEPRTLLVHYLRGNLGKTGTVVGCDTSNCGACTVHLDGVSVKSCSVLAVQADGCEVTTIEGLAQDGELHPMQKAFHEHHALQCGFCTPGMIMSACALLKDNPDPDETEIREGLEGNLCRCTGYQNIVAAVKAARHGGGGPSDRRRRALRELELGRRPPPQGGPAADHRPHEVDRQHRPAGHAAPRVRPQPLRPRAHHLGGHHGRQGLAQRRRGADRGRPRRRAGVPADGVADHQGHADAAPPGAGRGPRRVRRRGRGGRGRARPTARPATPPTWSTSTTRSCRSSSTSSGAAQDGADLVHAELGTNRSATWVFDSAEAGTGGDVEEAIAAARTDGVVIERRFRQQRLVPAFMEPRSTVVDPTGEQTTMWSATQVPHILRIMLALVTGVPESKIRVIAPDVGGGFGGKLQFTPEELVTFLVARRLGKPVKFTETRTESIMTGHHGRDQVQRLTLAARKDGTVTGLKVELLADMGAYLGLVTPGRPDPGRLHVQLDLQVRAPTGSPAPTSSPTRPGPTPTAAPGAPRRRSPSSG